MRAVLMLAVLAATPTAAQVDTTARTAGAAAFAPGQTVRDAKGAVVGRVESVAPGPDGRPRQVLVRTGGVARVGSTLKALPVTGLKPAEGGAVTVLTRAEVDALPNAPR